MKKLILFLLFPLWVAAQTANGTETKANAFRALSPQTVTSPTFLTTTGTDGTQGKSSNVVNQINSSNNSGILSFDGLAVNTDPTKYDIGAGVGYIMNSLTGVSTKVTWTAQTAQTTPYLLTSVATYVLKDNAGVTVLQNSAPTPQQYRTHIYLGKLAHTTFTTILFAVTEPSRMFDTTGQVSDINKFLGSGNIEGNVISYNGSNLNINASAGMTYRPGANFMSDRNSPSITSETSFTAGTFRNKFRNGSGGWSAVNTTTIDPNYYDDGTGILAVVPNNKWTIKVFWRFGGTGTIHCDYGQTVYDSKAQALEAVGKAVTAEDPETKRDASKRGWLVVKQGITVLNDITTAEFLQADKFGERAAGGSSTATMQTAYNNSVTPQITTSTGLGAVAFKRGSAVDTDNVLVVQNGSGSDTFSVKGNGDTAVFGLLAGVNGNFSSSMQAASFNVPGGTSSQFLKADGSLDSNVYATNSSVVHLSGTETISGNKTFTGQNTFTSASSSTAITATASTSGNGITVNNNSNGNGFTVNNNSTGVGEIINSATASTSDLTRWQKNGTTTSKVDHNGNITAPSFVKSGGLSSEYLKADGSVSTLINPITGTLTSGYIPKATGSNSLGNSLIQDDGTTIKIGTNTLGGLEFTPGSTILYDHLDRNNLAGVVNVASYARNGYFSWNIGSYTEAMRISYGGNFLIGTTTDDGVNRLQVNGSGKFTGTDIIMSTIESSNAIGSFFRFRKTSGTARDWDLGATGSSSGEGDNKFGLYDNTAGAFRIVVDDIGGIKITNLAGTGTRMVTADASGNLAASTIVTSGTYTPTLTNTSNITSSSLNQATYTRIGNIINVNVSVSTTVTATATPSVLTLTLPINTADTSQVGVGVGNITAGDVTVNASGIVGVISASTAEFVFYPIGSGSGTSAISFQYNLN